LIVQIIAVFQKLVLLSFLIKQIESVAGTDCQILLKQQTQGNPNSLYSIIS